MSYRVNALVREKPLTWYARFWRWFSRPTVTLHVPAEPEPEFNAKWAKEVADKYVADLPRNTHLLQALDHFRKLVKEASSKGLYYVEYEPFGTGSSFRDIDPCLRVRLATTFRAEVEKLGFRNEWSSPTDRIWWGRVELPPR